MSFNDDLSVGDGDVLDLLAVHLQLLADLPRPGKALIVQEHPVDADAHGHVGLEVPLVQHQDKRLVLVQYISEDEAGGDEPEGVAPDVHVDVVVFELYSCHGLMLYGCVLVIFLVELGGRREGLRRRDRVRVRV